MDVKNVFLQVTLEEEVYMKLCPASPERKTSTNPNLVCRLNKLIYGLKQSPRILYEKLSFFYYVILKLALLITLYSQNLIMD
jgi:Reverse transcriptase (RNA-dependent DNA polymerase)